MSGAIAIAEVAAALRAHPHELLLAPMVIAAAVIDMRTMRVPNWLTAGGAFAGLLGNVLWPGDVNGWGALAGLALGLVCTLPFWMLRVMGAGDAKLMAAVGAFLGAPAILGAVVFSFIVGGVGAVLFALRRRALRRMASNVADIGQGMLLAAIAGQRVIPFMNPEASVGKLPYGLAICVGTLAWVAAPLLHL